MHGKLSTLPGGLSLRERRLHVQQLNEVLYAFCFAPGSAVVQVSTRVFDRFASAIEPRSSC